MMLIWPVYADKYLTNILPMAQWSRIACSVSGGFLAWLPHHYRGMEGNSLCAIWIQWASRTSKVPWWYANVEESLALTRQIDNSIADVVKRSATSIADRLAKEWVGILSLIVNNDFPPVFTFGGLWVYFAHFFFFLVLLGICLLCQ